MCCWMVVRVEIVVVVVVVAVCVVDGAVVMDWLFWQGR